MMQLETESWSHFLYYLVMRQPIILLQNLGDCSSKENTLQNGDTVRTPCVRVEETALTMGTGSDHPNISNQLVATPGWTGTSLAPLH